MQAASGPREREGHLNLHQAQGYSKAAPKLVAGSREAPKTIPTLGRHVSVWDYTPEILIEVGRNRGHRTLIDAVSLSAGCD